MRMHRHHLLEIILWPNGNGTFRKIINTRERLRELEIYDDWKLTITIPADEHIRMHAHNRVDDTKRKMSAAKIGNTNAKGNKHSDDIKAKISAAQKGNTNAKGNKGKKHSEEAKAKMSAAKKGKKLSAEHRAKISATLKGKKYDQI